MLLFSYPIRNYYLYTGHIDFRKGIDGLCGIVTNELTQSPVSGDLYVFMNRRRNQLKMLHWQGDGYCVLYKRLEKGTYELPDVTNTKSMEISLQKLQFILQGVVLKSVRLRTRYEHKNV
jgi:transposase